MYLTQIMYKNLPIFKKKLKKFLEQAGSKQIRDWKRGACIELYCVLVHWAEKFH